MSDHILNNCKFYVADLSLKKKRTLELILFTYNNGWGYSLSQKLLPTNTLNDSTYIYVKEGTLWQINTSIPYEPFEDLPLLDVDIVLKNY